MNFEGARVISTSKDGRRAQIVLYTGEGSQRQSITRHIRMQGDTWVGRNPDEAALARLDEAERVLEKAEKQYEPLKPLIKITIKEVNKILGLMRQHRKEARGIPNVFLDVVGKNYEAAIAKIVKAEVKTKIKESAAILQTAAEYARKLRKEIPREVIFSV